MHPTEPSFAFGSRVRWSLTFGKWKSNENQKTLTPIVHACHFNGTVHDECVFTTSDKAHV